MELTPQDIGKERYLTLMRRRMTHSVHAGPHGHISSDILEQPQLSVRTRRRSRRLRKYWVRGLKLDDGTAEAVGDMAWAGSTSAGPKTAFVILSLYLFIATTFVAIAGPGFVPPLIPLALLFLWLVSAFGLVIRPQVAIRKMHTTSITTAEIDRMLPVARGRLERSYLNLVRDAIQQEIPSATAQVDIKSALRDLGDTISRLPADPVPTHDPDALHLDADEQRMKAQQEPDAFIQASLLRQAAALDRRAALAGQNASSARRASALRREAKSQIDALRAVMLAYQHTSPTDGVTVANLSESVQRVAQEAQAASVARRELDEEEISQLLGKPLPENLPPQPILPARKIIDPVGQAQPVTQPTLQAQEPPMQVLQAGRPWWRGQ